MKRRALCCLLPIVGTAAMLLSGCACSTTNKTPATQKVTPDGKDTLAPVGHPGPRY